MANLSMTAKQLGVNESLLLALLEEKAEKSEVEQKVFSTLLEKQEEIEKSEGREKSEKAIQSAVEAWTKQLPSIPNCVEYIKASFTLDDGLFKLESDDFAFGKKQVKGIGEFVSDEFRALAKAADNLPDDSEEIAAKEFIKRNLGKRYNVILSQAQWETTAQMLKESFDGAPDVQWTNLITTEEKKASIKFLYYKPTDAKEFVWSVNVKLGKGSSGKSTGSGTGRKGKYSLEWKSIVHTSIKKYLEARFADENSDDYDEDYAALVEAGTDYNRNQKAESLEKGKDYAPYSEQYAEQNGK